MPHYALPFPILYFSPLFYSNLLLILFAITFNTARKMLIINQLNANKK